MKTQTLELANKSKKYRLAGTRGSYKNSVIVPLRPKSNPLSPAIGTLTSNVDDMASLNSRTQSQQQDTVLNIANEG
ncbi:MAG: hypothetical protein AB4290_25180 [Spirulina sp.]